ncbi:hypothetical protein P7K49_005806 [Saguinus oedipus]|uniref:Uncharacterized protein n=1 Tax=Saguinus oedipus TaxID=9490 RepID=A0ABQ9W169_SAGOE|nr:hypothetical protein P7K49_005806 [Saguinus oedipus]
MPVLTDPRPDASLRPSLLPWSRAPEAPLQGRALAAQSCPAGGGAAGSPLVSSWPAGQAPQNKGWIVPHSGRSPPRPMLTAACFRPAALCGRRLCYQPNEAPPASRDSAAAPATGQEPGHQSHATRTTAPSRWPPHIRAVASLSPVPMGTSSCAATQCHSRWLKGVGPWPTLPAPPPLCLAVPTTAHLLCQARSQ